MEKMKGIIHDIANKLTISKSVNRKLENLLGKDHKEVKRLKKSLEDSILLLEDLRESSSKKQKKLPLENIQTIRDNDLLKVQSLMSLYDVEIQYRNEIENDVWINLSNYSSERILCNCIENAKRAGAKKVVIEYALKGNQLQLKIKDNGKGMSPDILEKIGYGYSSQDGDNHGIGTQVVRNIVQEAGGSIRWHSIEELGTCCNIKFNIISDESKIIKRKETQIKRDRLTNGSNFLDEKKVLVASNSPTELGIWQGFLTNIGAHVTTAEYGDVALNQIYKNKPDCLLFNKDLKDMKSTAWLSAVMSEQSLSKIPRVLYIDESENIDFVKNIPCDEIINYTKFDEKRIFQKLNTLLEDKEFKRIKKEDIAIAKEGETFSLWKTQKKAQ